MPRLELSQREWEVGGSVRLRSCARERESVCVRVSGVKSVSVGVCLLLTCYTMCLSGEWGNGVGVFLLSSFLLRGN